MATGISCPPSGLGPRRHPVSGGVFRDWSSLGRRCHQGLDTNQSSLASFRGHPIALQGCLCASWTARSASEDRSGPDTVRCGGIVSSKGLEGHFQVCNGAPGVGAGREAEKRGQPQIPPLPFHNAQHSAAKMPLGEVARAGNFASPRAGLPWDLPCWPARLE